MRKFAIIILYFCVKLKNDQIAERASGLTLRVLLAFFPFLVFLMALLGFLDLNVDAILDGLYAVLPGDEISNLVSNMLIPISATRSAGLLSFTLIVCIYYIANGFRYIINYTNMVYNVSEQRGILAQIGLSFILMLMFSAALITMLALLVFGRQLWSLIFPFGSELLFTLISAVSSLIILFIFTSYIYKSACAKKIPVKFVVPGAAFTVFFWVIVSAVFGYIMQNFSQFPTIYGSIAGIFILVLWLNSVSVVLLIGGEINALIYDFENNE